MLNADPDRIPCCIPFCRRTAARTKFPKSTEYICGIHWRAADSDKRREYRKIRKKNEQHTGSADDFEKWLSLWLVIKSQCIERAAK